MRIVILVLCLCSLLFGLAVFLFPILAGISMANWFLRESQVNSKSYTDTFRVTVLEAKSEPNYFTARIRVRCENGMDAGIWVTDLKEAGIFEVRGTKGEVFYREGHPHKAGQSGPVTADGKFSTCEIFLKVSTTLTNTIWHSRISTASTNVFSESKGSGGVDTMLRVPMMISGIQTNWPDSYQRGSAIPLANLGDCKILITVK